MLGTDHSTNGQPGRSSDQHSDSMLLLHTDPSITGLWLGFGGATLICLATTFIPIRIAVKRMKELER